MIKCIKNNTDIIKKYCGLEIEPGVVHEIDKNEEIKWANDPDVISSIENGDLLVGNGTFFTDVSKGIAWLQSPSSNQFPFSWASDLNNEDENISGTDPIRVPIKRILWDYNGDIDESGNFVIGKPGVYNWDIQLRLKDMVNVTATELAIYKVEEGADDYWFIMSHKENYNNLSMVQLSGMTQFDFHADEEYYLVVKLYGTNPSAVIDGNDDYTAWGSSWALPLVE